MAADTPTCCLCEQPVTADDMALTCPRAGGRRRRHEVLDPPEWRPGDPVHPGSSLHARGCERAKPSPFRYLPCTCKIGD